MRFVLEVVVPSHRLSAKDQAAIDEMIAYYAPSSGEAVRKCTRDLQELVMASFDAADAGARSRWSVPAECRVVAL